MVTGVVSITFPNLSPGVGRKLNREEQNHISQSNNLGPERRLAREVSSLFWLEPTSKSIDYKEPLPF